MGGWGWYRVRGGHAAGVRVGLTSSLGKVDKECTHCTLCTVRHTKHSGRRGLTKSAQTWHGLHIVHWPQEKQKSTKFEIEIQIRLRKCIF